MSNRNISIVNDRCCGCRACGDVCPKTCISFISDKEGFAYPVVDSVNCIDCGKCAKVCPVLNINKGESVSSSSVACYAKEEERRMLGSSGGYFGLLAEYVLAQGGVVYGAAFDNQLRVVHRVATNKEQLVQLYKSKYIQSNPQGVYNSVLRALELEKMVLFCGTPCQCNAVRNVVGGHDERLYLVDFVCHGVPPQQLFDECVHWIEKKRGIKVTRFTFRYKDQDTTHPRSYGIEYSKHGRSYKKQGLYYDIPFYYGFHQYLFLRPSCYSCKWSTVERCADITLGDYWGINKIDRSFDEYQGVSLVLFNTEKGHQLSQYVGTKDSCSYKELPLETAILNNSALCQPTKFPIQRDAFFRDYHSFGFDYVAQKYLSPRCGFVLKHYYAIPKVLRIFINRSKRVIWSI